MKRILLSLLVAALPFGSVLAQTQKDEEQGDRGLRARAAERARQEPQGHPRRIRPGRLLAGHMHPKSAFIYATVLEGAIRSQVNDGPAKVYKAGQNWSEQPGDRHRVSANASTTKPAKLLAVFVVDTNDKNIVLPLVE